jgi:hypothetical protein
VLWSAACTSKPRQNDGVFVATNNFAVSQSGVVSAVEGQLVGPASKMRTKPLASIGEFRR